MAYRRTSLMQERLADNRRQILLAARRLIARGGYREASIAAVAAEVGLSIGAIYRYFPSKADLFVELLTDAVSREMDILRGILEGSGRPLSACALPSSPSPPGHSRDPIWHMPSLLNRRKPKSRPRAFCADASSAICFARFSGRVSGPESFHRSPST